MLTLWGGQARGDRAALDVDPSVRVQPAVRVLPELPPALAWVSLADLMPSCWTLLCQGHTCHVSRGCSYLPPPSWVFHASLVP